MQGQTGPPMRHKEKMSLFFGFFENIPTAALPLPQ
jgi:hypothetical protein